MNEDRKPPARRIVERSGRPDWELDRDRKTPKSSSATMRYE